MMAASPGRVTWLGHATALIELDGVRLVTDPLLRRRTAHLRRVAKPVHEPLAAIDAVLVSHVHWDHLDLRSLDRLGRDVHVVVPRGAEVTVQNATIGVAATLLVDGMRVAEIAPGEGVEIYLAEQRSLLATLPETTFFSRYRETFSS